jgi:aconitate hydratase
MMRGTFANVRLKNALAPAPKAAGRRICSTAAMSIFDAAEVYRQAGVPLIILAGKGIRIGILTRLGGQGDDAAWREGRHCRELRAHPPQQSRNMGVLPLEFIDGATPLRSA